MSFDFHFTTLRDSHELGDLIAFMHRQDLGYPRYHEWVDRARTELAAGYKGSILAYSGGRLAGNLVFQPHKTVTSLLEIKNLRIHDQYRGRDFARFMVRQLEVEAQGNYDALIGDVREERHQLLVFMQSLGFIPIHTISLYEEEKREVVIVKFLRRKKDPLIMPLTQKVYEAISSKRL